MSNSQYCTKTEMTFAETPTKRLFAVLAAFAIAFCAVASAGGFTQTAYAEEPATNLVTAEAYEVDAVGSEAYEVDAVDDDDSALYDYDHGYGYDEYGYDDYGYYEYYQYCIMPLYFDFTLDEPVGVIKGKKIKLKPYLVNAEDKKLVWSSSKKKVATVNSKGVVKAKKPGTTKIKVANKNLADDYATITVTVLKKPVKTKIYKKIMKLKSKYREGKAWSNEKTYYWKKANTYCVACMALVGIISDKVFGKSAPIKVHHNYKKIKVGDHVRIGDAHSVIVLTKDKRGITVVEGNYNGRVHWGRYIKRSELKADGFAVWTRY